MRVTNRLRAKHPTLADEQIMNTIVNNRDFTLLQIKGICKYVFTALGISMIALLSAAAIAGTVAMIYNCFII